MKSSFLVTLILSALVCVSAWGQTNRRPRVQQKPRQLTQKPMAKKRSVSQPTVAKPAAATATTTQAITETAAVEKSPFNKFYDRLSINYFGVFTSPTLEDWNSANAGISPRFGDTGRRCRKNCDSYAMNLWNQINFGYDFGWKMKFVFIPRWTVMLANPRDMTRGAGEDRALVGIEDFLVGFAGVIYATEDKKFNWFVRPGLRLPTSHFSRHYNNGQFGQLTNNIELAHFITYDPNPQWQYGLMLQQRMWVYESRFNPSRLRYYTSPYISYSVNEKTKVQLYYQSMIENNKRWKSINGKDPVYKDVYQDMMIAVGRDITPRLNVMPYLGYFIDDIPLSMRSAYLGAWISYKIK